MNVNAPRLAVVGTGWWSSEFHIPSLTAYDGAELVGLVDSDPERLRRVAEHYADLPTYSSIDELIAAGAADGVVIATPPATHYDIAAKSLAAGLHVMLEKPMTIDSQQAWELVDIANTRSLHLTVGLTFQHTRAAQALRREIRSGAIGELVAVSGLFASMVEAYYRGSPEQYEEVFQWSINGPTAGTYSSNGMAGGGQAFTQLSHAFGMVLHVCGDPVREVYAKMNYRDLAVDLADAIAYEFWPGAIGTMCSTGNMRPREPHQQEFRYYGTRGYAIQDLVAGTMFVQRADGSTMEISGAEVGEVYPAFEPARHLADLIAGRCDVNKAPAIESAWATDALEAAYRSVESRRPELATSEEHWTGLNS